MFCMYYFIFLIIRFLLYFTKIVVYDELVLHHRLFEKQCSKLLQFAYSLDTLF